MMDEHWVDQRLSEELPILRTRGEGQTLDYKKEIPSNAQALGRTIAGFATSNSGHILVGVDDDGTLLGIAGAETPEGRDELVKRVSGICRTTVKPSITPAFAFAVESEKIVLVVSVPKGAEPVYYYDGKPYIRHSSESRPAEPHEVLNIIKSYLVASGAVISRGDDQLSQFLEALATYASEVLIFAAEINERSNSPWLERFQDRYRVIAQNLYTYAADPLAAEYNIKDLLRELAEACDAVVSYCLFLESWTEFQQLIETAASQAQSCLDVLRRKPSWPLSSSFVKTQLQRSLSELEDLSSRAKQMVANNRIDEIREIVSAAGFRILQALQLAAAALDNEQSDRLRQLATKLHLQETEMIMADGGLGEQRTLETICECVRELQSLSK